MSTLTHSLRAHFDGKYIIPDEPVDLPVDAPLEIEVKASASRNTRDSESIQRKLAALERFTAHGESGTAIPADALRREAIYGDQER